MRHFLPVALISLAVPALAGQPWIGPTDYTPFPQEQVEVHCVAGSGFSGPAEPRSGSAIRNVWVRDAATRDVSSAGSDGAGCLTRVTNSDDHGLLVGWRSTPARREHESAAFHHYLADNGCRDALAQRELAGATWPGKELAEGSGKSWIAGSDVRRAREPMGVPLEIVPMRDPAIVESLEVEVLYEGRPLPGALLKVYRQNLGENGLPIAVNEKVYQPCEQKILTDRIGRARIDVDARGEYLVTCMHAVPGRDLADAGRSWGSHAASLTFARGAALDDDDGAWPRFNRQGYGTDPARVAYEAVPARERLKR